MARKSKEPEELRGVLSARVLPELEERVLALSVKWDRSKSATVERLVRRGLLAVEQQDDAHLGELLDLWPTLSPESRAHLVAVAQTFRRVVPVSARISGGSSARANARVIRAPKPTDQEIEAELAKLAKQIDGERREAIAMGGKDIVPDHLWQASRERRLAQERERLLQLREQNKADKDE